MGDLREQHLAAWTERRGGEIRAMLASGSSKPAPLCWCLWDPSNTTLGGPSADRVFLRAMATFPAWASMVPEWHATDYNPHDEGFYVSTLVKGRASFWGRPLTIRIVVDQPPTEGSGFRVLRVEEVALG